jgi:hypothetical protein
MNPARTLAVAAYGPRIAVAFFRRPDYTPRTVSAHRLAVRTPPSHGGNRGSIPLGRTSFSAYTNHSVAGLLPELGAIGGIGGLVNTGKAVRTSIAAGNLRSGVLRHSGRGRVHADFRRLDRTQQA